MEKNLKQKVDQNDENKYEAVQILADNYGFNVSMTSPSIQFQILNHGIYDKKYGEMSRFRFWSDKWGAMNNADKQRLSDDADERFQRNVNQVNLLP